MNQSGTTRGHIKWEEYFMGLALLSAERSKDPECKVGACIVNEDNIVVGLGYNGFPRGCHDDLFPWSKDKSEPLNDKHMYVCHAEANAILNKNSSDIKGCTIYVTRFPCNECAKLIIQSGIKLVVHRRDEKAHKDKYAASKMMFVVADVKYRQFESERRDITIHFQ